MIDNSADDWRIAMTWQRIMQLGIELLICGHLYVIDFKNMVQYRKNQGFGGGGRKRKIKRDILTASCKGVAGLVAKD